MSDEKVNNKQLGQWIYVAMRESETRASKCLLRYEDHRNKKMPSCHDWLEYIKAKKEAEYYKMALENLRSGIQRTIYLCNAGLLDVAQETIDFGSDAMAIPFTRYEKELVFNFVSAQTRGKAKSLFLETVDLDWIDPLSVRKVCVSCFPDGILPWNVCEILPLWKIVDDRNLLQYEQEPTA